VVEAHLPASVTIDASVVREASIHARGGPGGLLVKAELASCVPEMVRPRYKGFFGHRTTRRAAACKIFRHPPESGGNAGQGRLVSPGFSPGRVP